MVHIEVMYCILHIMVHIEMMYCICICPQVGDDRFGHDTIQNFQNNNINVRGEGVHSEG